MKGFRTSCSFSSPELSLSQGLRYFNVFGPRQDPNGAYAAVIPKWIGAMIAGEQVFINGDGESSRDFTFVDNAVQANLLAATSRARRALEAINEVYNVAVGECTTLNRLFSELSRLLAPQLPHSVRARPIYCDFRAGDVRHSLADISKAKELLGYAPTHHFAQGLALTVQSALDRETKRTGETGITVAQE